MKEGQTDSHVQDFLVSVDKFICNLSSASRNTKDKFQLYNMESAPDLSQLQEPEDYISAGKSCQRNDEFWRKFADKPLELSNITCVYVYGI